MVAAVLNSFVRGERASRSSFGILNARPTIDDFCLARAGMIAGLRSCFCLCKSWPVASTLDRDSLFFSSTVILFSIVFWAVQFSQVLFSQCASAEDPVVVV